MIAYLLGAVAAAAALYQVLALLACIRHMLSRERKASRFPGISILKPVRGLDPRFYSAIRSHAAQDYPKFEILFGVNDPADHAVAEIEKLQAEFPRVPIYIVRSARDAPNGKVGTLLDLNERAQFPIRVVNDGDIRVPGNYLRRLAASLEDERTGLVTCLYRACAGSWAAQLEALGIATDFAPGVLVAPMFGVNEFGLGSTLAFRARDLERSGGFSAIQHYIADDYQLGKRISRIGLRVILSKMVVETNLSGRTWREVWKHQVRWARTIRTSQGAGYIGLPVTNASLWALALALAGWWWMAAALLALRLTAGTAGIAILKDPLSASRWYLIPLRDLLGLAVWLAGLSGNTVVWRDRTMKLDRSGRIVKIE